MGKARLLIVEDDVDIANMLKIYFTSQGYDVDLALRGSEALDKTRHSMPHLIVLDIMLPDLDGYSVCRQLRTTTRTSHIPVIFLTQKDERSDRLQGLELGADDYITKPFDIEELKLRVQNAVARSERESLTDPQTGLPAGRLIEDRLRQVIRQQGGWSYLDIRVNHFEPFKESYGFIAGNDVLSFLGMLLGEVVDQAGTPADFIGHAGGDTFVIISSEEGGPVIRQHIKERFPIEVQSYYNFVDRQNGYISVPDGQGGSRQAPLMSVSIGVVSPSKYAFSDIREITEIAAEERRRDVA